MESVSTVKNESIWQERLKDTNSAVSFLSKRVIELSESLSTQNVIPIETNLINRIRWFAQIAFQLLRSVVYSLLTGCASLLSIKNLTRTFSIKLSDSAGEGESLLLRFKCFEELLSLSYNKHDLEASNSYFQQDIEMNGKNFDTLQFGGKCHGMCSLFCILLLKAREPLDHSDTQEIREWKLMDMTEQIEKIGTLFQNGAPPEASILQEMQGFTEVEVFSSLFKEFKDLYYSDFSFRKYQPSWNLSREMAYAKDNSASNVLNKLAQGVPYYITNRLPVIHSNLLIRTGPQEFYLFDPSVGICKFEGEEGMRRLPKMFGYGEVTKAEINRVTRNKKNIRDFCDDNQFYFTEEVFKGLSEGKKLQETITEIRNKFSTKWTDNPNWLDCSIIQEIYTKYSPEHIITIPSNSIEIKPYFQKIVQLEYPPHLKQ